MRLVRGSVTSVLPFCGALLVVSGWLSGDGGDIPVRTTIEQDPAAERDLDARYLASTVFPRRPVSLSSSETTTVIRFRGPVEGKDRFLIPDLRRYRMERPGAAPLPVLFFPRNPLDLSPRLVVWDAQRGTHRFVQPPVDVVARVSEAKDKDAGVLPGGGSAFLSSASLADAKPADARLYPLGDRWVLRVRIEERLPGGEGSVIPWRQAMFDISTGMATWDWSDPAFGHRLVLAAGVFKEDGQDAHVALSVDVLRDVQSPSGIVRVRPVGIEDVRRMARGVPSEVSLSNPFGVRSSHLVAIFEIR